jgi:hypothetical protein
MYIQSYLYIPKIYHILTDLIIQTVKESCSDPQINRTRTSNRIVHESKNPINNRTRTTFLD